MFINEVKAEGYNIFRNMTDKRERGKQVNAVKYIAELASMSQTDIRQWNLVDIFTTNGLFPVNRQKINKIFFAHKSSFAGLEYTIPGPLLTELKALETRIPSRDLSRVDRDIIKLKANIARQETNIKNYMRDLRRKVDFKLNLEGTVMDFATMAQKVESEGFWELKSIDDTSLIFETKNEVYLKYKNDAQSVDLNVNMGRFRCTYNVSRGSVMVSGCGNNLYDNGRGYYHPHINSSGRLCIGDMSNRYSDALAYKLIDDVMEIVQCALTIYNHDSPYTRIDTFNERRIRLEQEQLGEQMLADIIEELGIYGQKQMEEETREEPNESITCTTSIHQSGTYQVGVQSETDSSF